MGDRVFLDANILFSAAYRESGGLLRLWELRDRIMLSSAYAAEEARRNLSEQAQLRRLEGLLARTEILAGASRDLVPADVDLVDKDRPILSAAIAMNASHLVTGDERHFGHLFGQAIQSVQVTRAQDYLRDA